MRYVMGVDPSLTCTGVVVLGDDGSLIVSDRVTSTPAGRNVSSRMRRCQSLFSGVMRSAEKFKPEVVCIEAYALGANMPGVADRVELGALLRFSLIAAGFKLIEVAPTTLKKWATGAGKGGKTPVIAALTKRYGIEFASDDEYDAYALARMGLQIEQLEQPEHKYQQEAVNVASGKAK